jgi:hypothetical protein
VSVGARRFDGVNKGISSILDLRNCIAGARFHSIARRLASLYTLGDTHGDSCAHDSL